MAGFVTAFAGDVWKLLFLGTPIAGVADNAASSPLTVWELSLHSAQPTTSQSHNEVAYEGYGRVAVSRSGTGFEVTDNVISFVSEVEFAEVISGVMAATWLGFGTAHTGAGSLKLAFPISPAISIYPGQIPRIKESSNFSLT